MPAKLGRSIDFRPQTYRMSELPFGRLNWWIGFIAIFSFVVQDAFGSTLLYISMVLVLISSAYRMERVKRGLTIAGRLPWIMPVFSLISTVWSAEPAITLRLSMEVILTIGIALYVAIENDADDCIIAVSLATSIACVLSIAVDHPYHDLQTNTISSAGIYAQKNVLGYTATLCLLSGLRIVLSRHYDRSIRAFGGACLLLGTYVALSAREMTGLAAGFIGVCYFLVTWVSTCVHRRSRIAYLQFSNIIMTLIAVIISLASTVYGADVLRMFGKDPTLTGRTVLWEFARRISIDNPILGVGYQAFWVQGHPMAEFLWKRFQQPARDHFNFHSTGYFVLTELGCVGLLLLILYIAQTIRLAVKWIGNSDGADAIFHAAFILYITIYSQFEVGLFFYFSTGYVIVTIGTFHARLVVIKSVAGLPFSCDGRLASAMRSAPRTELGVTPIWQHPTTPDACSQHRFKSMQ